MATQDDGNLAQLMANLLTSHRPLVEEDVDAEINRRLAAMMDAGAAGQPPA
ncbi:hypothetical protein [Arthrobacter sp. 2MCAF14]|uniref:hypothetical protein n=1 Tax=Arthrobacter sp. 2MCAF14 TaxID=3232982 RepID=UPI003F90C38B